MHYEIKCMHGLGDNIFARPFIKSWAKHNKDLALITPWPELFSDLPVRFFQPQSSLRTQAKNIARIPQSFWQPRVNVQKTFQLAYNDLTLKQCGSITKVLERYLPLVPGDIYELDLPPPMRTRFRTANAIIRPVTRRKEWDNTARNPNPEYVYQIAECLMATHDVILLADIDEKIETLEGPLPPHHRAYIRGERSAFDALRMIADANVVVGGVGWIVPAALAAGTPAFIILGGQAAHNSPAIITDPRMNLSRMGFAKPDNYCNCNSMRHACDKRISNLMEQWERFTARIKS